MPKTVRKCSKCEKPGHRADRCPTGARPTPTRNKAGQPRGVLAGASNGESRSDFLATARESAKAAVRKKVEEELAWARAYIAELERLV